MTCHVFVSQGHMPLSQGYVGVSWLLEHKWALPWIHILEAGAGGNV